MPEACVSFQVSYWGEKENANSITSSARNNKYRFLISKYNMCLYHAVHRPKAKHITIAMKRAVKLHFPENQLRTDHTILIQCYLTSIATEAQRFFRGSYHGSYTQYYVRNHYPVLEPSLSSPIVLSVTAARSGRNSTSGTPCAAPSDEPVPHLAPEARHVAACRAFRV